MQSKKYVVLNDGQHDYNIIDRKTAKGHRVLTLSHSDADYWTMHARGKMLLKMTDTGNGVRFSKNIKQLGYDDLAHMRILINFAKVTHVNLMESLGTFDIFEETEIGLSGAPLKI